MANSTNAKSIQCAPRGAAGGSAGRFKVNTVVSSELTEDDWSDAEADAFFDALVERNKEALRGLAEL